MSAFTHGNLAICLQSVRLRYTMGKAKGKILRDELKMQASAAPICRVFVGVIEALTSFPTGTPRPGVPLKERASVSCAGLLVILHEVVDGGGVTILDLVSHAFK
jgi:hypothetical protein